MKENPSDWFHRKMREFKNDPEFQAELFILIVEEAGTEGREDG